MKKRIFLLGFMGLFAGSFAQAGGVGTGGDPLSIEFDNARIYAANRVANAVDCAMGANVPVGVREWILANKEQLADDIMGTQYIWSTESQVTCGWTQSSPKADITFSYPVCRPAVKDVMDAIWMVVHESVHHFGFPEEAFPNAVADAIIDLGLNSSCTEPPAQDPFDPASCPGNPISEANLLSMVGLPNTNTRTIGEFNVYFRKRMCYSPLLCKPWSTGLDDKEEFSWSQARYVDIRYDLPTHGTVAVEFALNQARLNLTSDTKDGVYWSYYASIDDKLGMIENAFYVPNPVAITRMVGGDASSALRRGQGLMTNSCLRQTVSGSKVGLDDKGNTITWNYDAVILGRFTNAAVTPER